MSTILNKTTAAEDAIKISAERDQTENGITLVRAWPKIDATYADELVIALQAVPTYVNPKADNQTYKGASTDWTFVNSSSESRASSGADTADRSLTIVQKLIQIVSPTTHTDLAGYNYIVDNIIKDGSSEVSRTLIFKNINPNSTTETALISTITDADLKTAFGSTQPYVDRRFVIQADRTAWFYLIFHSDLSTGRDLRSTLGTYSPFRMESVIFPSNDGEPAYGPWVQQTSLIVTTDASAAENYADSSSKSIVAGAANAGYRFGYVARDLKSGYYLGYKIQLDQPAVGNAYPTYALARFESTGSYTLRNL